MRDVDPATSDVQAPEARALRRQAAWAAAGYLARTCGLAALRRALTTYLGLFVVALILFAGNGLRASDVVALARGSSPVRGGLLLAWLVLSLPAARAIVREPAAFWIRVWPVPRATVLATVVSLLVLVEAPWIILWAKGGGAGAGAWATAIALGGHGLWLARPCTRLERGGAVGWAVSFAVMPWSALLASILAAPVVWLSVRRAWIAAPQRIGVQRVVRLVSVGRWPVVAWARAQLAMILRVQRPAATRALWFVAAGAAATKLAIANNGITDVARARAIWRAAAALSAAWGAAGLIGGVCRVETQSRWLLDVCGASAVVRRGGAWLAIVGPAVVLVVIAGTSLAWAGTPASSGPGAPSALAAWILQGVTAAVAGAGLAVACGRWACRGDGRDGARLLSSVLAASSALAALAALGGVGWLGGVALAALLMPEARRRRLRGGPPTLAGEV